MIDLHSHLLPNTDDGSRSVEQSVAVLQVFAADGVEGVALTPHIDVVEIEDHGEDAVEHRDETFAILKERAPARPELYLGFEIMLNRPISDSTFRDGRFALAGSRYHLVEFPLSVAPAAATAALEQVVAHGVVPVVAHPERYRHCGMEAVAAWRKLGAKVQLDAVTLTRRHPWGRRARELLASGLADILAADNHGDAKSIVVAVRYLIDRGCEHAARLLAVENPRAVVDGGEMVEVPPVRLADGWARHFGER